MMQEFEHAFQAIKKEIEQEAQNEVKAILDEIAQMESHVKEATAREARRNAQLKLDQELERIQSEAAEEIAALNATRRKKLVDQRNSYMTSIMEEAASRLKAFTQSAAYRDFLMGKVKQAADYHLQDVIIYVKQDDFPYAEALKEAYGNPAVVEISDTITIGGLMIVDHQAGVVIDETLETALEGQRDYLIAHSGMTIK